MPPLPPVQNVVKANLIGTYGSQPWNIGHFLQYVGPAPQQPDLITITNAIVGAYATNLAPLAFTNVILLTVKLADLTSPNAATGEFVTNNPGTRVGTQLPVSAAVVSSWKINVRYRGGHPRSYWPFGVVADITTGRTLVSTFETAMRTALQNYLTAMNAITASGTTYKMVAVRYRSNHTALLPPVPYIIQTVTVHGRLDTQRRRLGKEIP